MTFNYKKIYNDIFHFFFKSFFQYLEADFLEGDDLINVL